MNQKINRKIQVASFSINDVSKTNIGVFLLAVALILSAIGMAYVAVVNARTAVQAISISRIMITAAEQSEQGARRYSNGGASQFASAAVSGPALNSAFGELDSSLFVLPSLKNATTSALASWASFSDALMDVWKVAGPASDLSKASGSVSGNFAALLKAVEASGKANAELRKEHESLIRLYSYSESGFGASSIPRFVNDLRQVSSNLAVTELKENSAFINDLLPLAKLAADQQMTNEKLSRIVVTASAAKAEAESLLNSANKIGTGNSFTTGALALAVIGIALFGFTLIKIIDDVGRRYHRALQQFRSDEEDAKELIEKLGLAAMGDSTNINLKNSESVFKKIAIHVNTILNTQAERIEKIVESVHCATENQSIALSFIQSTESEMKAAVDGINDSASTLSKAIELVRLIRLDARAASSTAQESKVHASDANRMSQDAASRLDAFRDGLQETSKGIKRLGERAQEINAVVDEMGIFSEQIGALALNANLEAERAGDAGAGFRVVAREVQSLARKSEESLVRISTLVMGAQADARSATEAVEKSTSQIASGSNIGAVSQSLIASLAPLSAGVNAITKSITETCKDAESILASTVVGVQSALASAREALAKSSHVMAPMIKAQGNLNAVESE